MFDFEINCASSKTYRYTIATKLISKNKETLYIYTKKIF